MSWMPTRWPDELVFLSFFLWGSCGCCAVFKPRLVVAGEVWGDVKSKEKSRMMQIKKKKKRRMTAGSLCYNILLSSLVSTKMSQKLLPDRLTYTLLLHLSRQVQREFIGFASRVFAAGERQSGELCHVLMFVGFNSPCHASPRLFCRVSFSFPFS